ncbi:hypothetical protein [Sphingobium yanoikuyae]|uniref:hypothetical protein n=1 Tax=Sphingobium yanoikuyae TaxID=13690 RepID=UPI0012DA80B5|nr:hypothetical protein [Sphingobium yanoikuyae]
MTNDADPFNRLSTRARKLLSTNGITSLHDLCNKTHREVRRLPGCGYVIGSEIANLLKEYGLVFRTDIPDRLFADLCDQLRTRHNTLLDRNNPSWNFHNTSQDFRGIGEHYGVTADVAYQIFSGAERAKKMYDKALTEHLKWKSQFHDDSQSDCPTGNLS